MNRDPKRETAMQVLVDGKPTGLRVLNDVKVILPGLHITITHEGIVTDVVRDGWVIHSGWAVHDALEEADAKDKALCGFTDGQEEKLVCARRKAHPGNHMTAQRLSKGPGLGEPVSPTGRNPRPPPKYQPIRPGPLSKPKYQPIPPLPPYGVCRRCAGRGFVEKTGPIRHGEKLTRQCRSCHGTRVQKA